MRLLCANTRAYTTTTAGAGGRVGRFGGVAEGYNGISGAVGGRVEGRPTPYTTIHGHMMTGGRQSNREDSL